MLSSLFPQWMPPWAQAVLLVGGILFTLVWLLVPFAVFGVKGRLDNLAIQLDDLQAELRVMSMGINTPPTSTPMPVAQADPAAPVPRRQPPAPAGTDPVWDPTPAARPPARAVPEPVEDESDIPAYERRAPRSSPAAPVSVAPPRAEPATGRGGTEDWPPRPAKAPPASREPASRADEGPSLSEWSRRLPGSAPDSAAVRPLRASVWPPERGQRAEPTLRWPPRREG
ncbi:hypothetical protein D3W54_12640 [Komagataeibacter medellinensis]|uniref:Uncharacterized protein n=1 Tax=Komagataeibacter medellinensis TaxID=1177712 RepID=A0ABQ6VXY8_9PROT|nr:hypothetical protein [Komagataeibacter medellinensis]KAB8124902.1 hypothetical protein D3W54_12640 [Komagataeibacter medellinensis]